MTDQAGFHVDPAAVRAEAKLWDEQAAVANRISDRVDRLRFYRNEVGMFSLFVPEYHKLVGAVVTCALDGEQRMAEISQALLAILGNYERLDRRGATRMKLEPDYGVTMRQGR